MTEPLFNLADQLTDEGADNLRKFVRELKVMICLNSRGKIVWSPKIDLYEIHDIDGCVRPARNLSAAIGQLNSQPRKTR